MRTTGSGATSTESMGVIATAQSAGGIGRMRTPTFSSQNLRVRAAVREADYIRGGSIGARTRLDIHTFEYVIRNTVVAMG